MKTHLSIVPAAVFGLSLLGLSTVHAIEISQGTMLANSCAACHGTDGNSPGAIPSIHGKSAEFISTSLKEFRSGQRESTVMGRHATGYTDAEIKMIADYFAGLE